MKLRFVVAMSWRELRAARGRFAFYASCMAVGIAVVVGLDALGEAVERAVDLRSKEMLGADLRLESRDLPGPGVARMLESLEARALAEPTRIVRLGSMALAERSGRSRLVDLLAIEGTYPLYGEVWTEPAGRWRDFDRGEGRVYVDSALLVQLDLAIGDRLRIGGESFEVAAAVEKAPGRFGLQMEIAPRVFLRMRDLERLDLVREGSLVTHLRYLKLPEGVVGPWLEENGEALDEAHVRVQTVRGYREDMTGAFDVLTRYLGLVGIAALMLGSVGVAAGVRVFVREKLPAVALLRSIGASPREVVAIHALLALALGLLAGVLGLLLCLPLLWILPAVFGDLLPVEVDLRIGWPGIATGLGLSIWATLLCAMGPISELASVSPQSALRHDFDPQTRRWTLRNAVLGGVVVASLVAVSIWQAGEPRVGLAFAAGLVAAVAFLGLSARLLIRLLRRFPPRSFAYWARQAIANLSRPRNHTLATTIAIGFALFVVATVHSVQSNILTSMAIDTRPDRPNFVLFDVQKDQLEEMRDFLRDHGARVVDEAPLVSARLSGIAGKSRSDWLAEPDLPGELRWALQREYRLTYSDSLRDTEELVAGTWWKTGGEPVAGPVPVSVEQQLAKTLDVGVGDRLGWQIQGVPVESVVASLRRVDWGRMATNFFVVFPPWALEEAPQTTVLLSRLADESARAEMQRDLLGRFPNVSALDATLILRSLDAMLGQIDIAIQLLSSFTLATGIAILIAASLAGRRERIREMLLLRVLGASRSTLTRIAVTETLVLAGLASLTGGLLSLAAAWATITFVFDLPFAPPLWDLLLLVLGTFCVTVLFGGIVGWGGSQRRLESPQAALRREGIIG
ncbi:MAG TPA: FtsX-like permease family protein [Deltaproteobacteria bacterium]|nr:FtsX-like permease family protein [Deltaproteobacteria bacterium]